MNKLILYGLAGTRAIYIAESCFPEDLNKHMRKRRIDFDEFEIRTSSGRVYFNTRRARNEIREHFKDGIKCHYFSREEIERYNEIYKFGLTHADMDRYAADQEGEKQCQE